MWSFSLRFTLGTIFALTLSSTSFAMNVLHSFEFPPEKKQQVSTQQPVSPETEKQYETANSVKK